MAQVVDALAGPWEVAERGGEHPPRAFGETPREWEAEVGTLRSRDAQIELSVRHAQQHARVRPQVAELVDLVVPSPRRAKVPERGMVGLEHVERERLRPRMAVEPCADEAAVVIPPVTRVGGRMHRDHRQAAGAQSGEQRALLFR